MEVYLLIRHSNDPDESVNVDQIQVFANREEAYFRASYYVKKQMESFSANDPQDEGYSQYNKICQLIKDKQDIEVLKEYNNWQTKCLHPYDVVLFKVEPANIIV